MVEFDDGYRSQFIQAKLNKNNSYDDLNPCPKQKGIPKVNILVMVSKLNVSNPHLKKNSRKSITFNII